MNNRDQPAFPNHPNPAADRGLSKREYFAGLAMQGILSSKTALYTNNGGSTEKSAKAKAEVAVALADALLAELERSTE